MGWSIDGETYTLPRLSTRVWLDALVLKPPGCWLTLIPGRLPQDQAEHLYARLLDPEDALDIDPLEGIATAVLERVCGVWWWAAHRLAVSAVSGWMVFDGWCVQRGFSPLSEPIARVLSAAYAWRADRCTTDAELRQLDAELWAPAPPTLPSGRLRDAAPEGWDDAVEASMFETAMANLGRR